MLTFLPKFSISILFLKVKYWAEIIFTNMPGLPNCPILYFLFFFTGQVLGNCSILYVSINIVKCMNTRFDVKFLILFFSVLNCHSLNNFFQSVYNLWHLQILNVFVTDLFTVRFTIHFSYFLVFLFLCVLFHFLTSFGIWVKTLYSPI